MWQIYLLGLFLFEAIADVFAKEFSLRPTKLFAITSILFYVVCNSFWLASIRSGSGLVRGAFVFSIGNSIVALAIGWLMYDERIGFYGWLGIFLALPAIVLLAMAKP